MDGLDARCAPTIALRTLLGNGEPGRRPTHPVFMYRKTSVGGQRRLPQRQSQTMRYLRPRTAGHHRWEAYRAARIFLHPVPLLPRSATRGHQNSRSRCWSISPGTSDEGVFKNMCFAQMEKPQVARNPVTPRRWLQCTAKEDDIGRLSRWTLMLDTSVQSWSSSFGQGPSGEGRSGLVGKSASYLWLGITPQGRSASPRMLFAYSNFDIALPGMFADKAAKMSEDVTGACRRRVGRFCAISH